MAVTGSEKLFESARTAINDAKCRNPAEIFQVFKGLIWVSVSLFILLLILPYQGEVSACFLGQTSS